MDDHKKERRKQYKKKWMSKSRALLKTMSSLGDIESSEESSDETQTIPTCSKMPVLDASFCVVERNEGTASVSTSKNLTADNECRVDLRDTGTCSADSDVINETDSEWDWDMIDRHEGKNESEDDFNEPESTLSSDLSEWATECRINHTAVDKLLKVLSKHGCTDLPTTARTLLKTKRTVETQVISNMRYYNFGLESELKKKLDNYTIEQISRINTLDISLNIDGLPLFKSSKTSLWPILCSIDNIDPKIVFPVALTLGTSKPDNLDFLNETINELDLILQQGITFNEKLIQVNLKCIVCDAPAKAMVKGIKLYSGYFGCDRCDQRGCWIGRMTYQTIDNLNLRTDVMFRRQSQPEHHRVRSPFCNLGINMIKSFPIDYMHQVCLGVMKRLLLVWMRGKKKETKISFLNIDEISSKLIMLQRFIPRFFARKPRSLHEIDYWKATEFRQFLLYTGKLVLKGILRDDLYDNFMTLSVAISILVSPQLVASYANYAKELLIHFVHQARNLYGDEFLVYNVHSLLHLGDDAVEYGSLGDCSAFSFENHMQHIKKMVRSGKNPLSQIVKRICEFEEVKSKPFSVKQSKLVNKRPNNAFILDHSSCCEVVGERQELDDNEKYIILCRVFTRGEPIFLTPCDSRIIGCSKFLKRNCQMKMVPVQSLDHHAILIDSTATHVTCLGILHEF